MKELEGYTIDSIQVSPDQAYLRVKCRPKYSHRGGIHAVFVFIAEGDCCSESWFADIVGVDALLGHRVVSVEEMPMDNYNVDDGRTRQDSDEAYGYKIKTHAGVCDIVFRNSSNGYYGGTLCSCIESPCGKYRLEKPGCWVPNVFYDRGDTLDSPAWTPVTSDWSA